MIEVQDLVKWYGPTRAVDRISFQIPEGQIVGFLGPNGAGKSTTLRILSGYLPPTSGSARLAGLDVHAQANDARAKLGYLPENNPLYPEMRVVEYLAYRGKLMSLPRAECLKRIDYVVERCGLAAVRRRVIGRLSKGNRQRVGLASALLHNPPVLILDEPTSGLDPNQIGQVRQLITELRGQHTILLSSHILPEVEKVADRVIIIAGGRIRADGTLAELRKRIETGAKVCVELKAAPEAVQRAFTAAPEVQAVHAERQGDWCRVLVTPKADADPRSTLAQTALSNGWAVREMRTDAATLEQFFIRVTAEAAVEAA